MNKKEIIFFSVAGLFFYGVYKYYASVSPYVYRMKKILEANVIEGEIDTPIEAIAKTKGLVEFESKELKHPRDKGWIANVYWMDKSTRLYHYREGEQTRLENGLITIEEYSEGEIKAKKMRDHWEVRLSHSQLLPALICKALFDKEGTVIRKPSCRGGK